MKKIWLAVATGILGMVFASSLVWSQASAGVTGSQVIAH